MLEITGYEIEETLDESRQSTVVRVKRETDGKNFILKWYETTKDFQKIRAQANFELELSRKLSSPGVVQAYEVLENHNGCGILTEDFGGVSLRQLITSLQLDFARKLDLAVKMAGNLHFLHQEHVIHKDVNPNNFIVNPETWEVKITDFGISTLLSREEQNYVAPERLQGTLAYISPEQTGRMNRAIDYRSDIYSLGISFYELFTGRLPFTADDPVGWVHNHIVVEPEALNVLNPEVPEILSRIVLRMITKNAEARYQSAYGIQHDLAFCLSEWNEQENIRPFSLGEMDFSGRFKIEEKLYGRETELSQLEDAFREVLEVGACKFVLLGGPSGIGKSALAHEVQPAVNEQKGFFLQGKFEQLRANVPYLGITQAFRNLVEQLVTADEEKLRYWRDKILQEVGPNVRLLSELIPDLELIIGEQPAVAELSATEEQERFLTTFRNFISVFAERENPLVIFLDDLQWADGASLNLLKLFFNEESNQYLMLITAYRDDEAQPTLKGFIEEMETKAQIQKVIPGNLDLNHVKQLIQDSLPMKSRELMELSQLIYNRTEGNPLLVLEFLRILYEKEILTFNAVTSRWVYDISEIESQGVTGNMLDMMMERLNQLPEQSYEMIKVASCVGISFDLYTLSLMGNIDLNNALQSIWPAVESGLLIPQGEARHIMGSDQGETFSLEPKQAKRLEYRFLHERGQQAGYGSIAEKEKQRLHLDIGRELLNESSDVNDELYEITGHLNKGRQLLNDPQEIKKLFELNIQAGEKANQALAYHVARSYLDVALELAPDRLWEQGYEKALDLHREYALTLLFSAECPELMDFCETTLENISVVEDRIPFNLYQIRAGANTSEHKPSIKIAIQALKSLGVSIPEQPGKLSTAFWLMYALFRVGRLRESDISSQSFPGERKFYLISDILSELLFVSFIPAPEVFMIATARNFLMGLKRGMTSSALQSTALLLGILAKMMGRIKKAMELEKSVLELAGKPEYKKDLDKINWMFLQVSDNLWTPVKELDHKINETAIKMRQDGNLLLSQQLETTGKLCNFLWGDNLTALHTNLSDHLKQVRGAVGDYPVLKDVFENICSYMDILGVSPDSRKADSGLDVSTQIKVSDDPYVIAVSEVFKLMVAYLLRDSESINSARKEIPRYTQVFSLGVFPEFILFYDGLAGLFEWPNLNFTKRLKVKRQVRKALGRLKKLSDLNPDAYESMYLLLAAEWKSVGNHSYRDVLLAYHHALDSARRYERIHFEAMSLELRGLYKQVQGFPQEGLLDISEAARQYERWGAMNKVQALIQKFPAIAGRQDAAGRSMNTYSTTTSAGRSTTITTDSHVSSGTSGTSSTTMGQMDLGSALKATRSLAGEMDCNRLTEQLMDIVMENAGAGRGMLFLNSGKTLLLEAIRDLGRDHKAGASENAELGKSFQELAKSNEFLAGAVMRYALRTRNNLVVHDALSHETFKNDPFVQSQEIRSVLCVPLVHQGKLIGALYLENQTTPGAFTERRLEILQMLSSQAAVSIENAKLYTDMEAKVEQRTVQLRASKKQTDDILDNVSQGIITFGPDFRVNSEYSKMSPGIFERKEIAGLDFTELFRNSEIQTKLRKYLPELLSNEFMSPKMLNRLNPVDSVIFDYTGEDNKSAFKILNVKFSLVQEQQDSEENPGKGNQKIMAVIDDSTREYELKMEMERRTQEKQEHVEKIYSILSLEPEVFTGFLEESRVTIQLTGRKIKELSMGEDLKSEERRELVNICMRETHTLKGNARALNLSTISRAAHNLESFFELILETNEHLNEEKKLELLESLDILNSEIADGDKLFDKMLNMKQVLSSEPGQDKLEKTLLRALAVESQASGKKVRLSYDNQLETNLSPEFNLALSNSLTQVVRNSVAHGLETPNEREESSKPEFGNIRVQLTAAEKGFTVICEDDGRGLDVDKIRRKALEQGLGSAEELEQLDKKGVYQMIFRPGFSTAAQVTESAGRGAGMDIVANEIGKLQGSIAVQSKPGAYTRFIFSILG